MFASEIMKRATEDHVVKAKGDKTLEGGHLTKFLLNVQEYELVSQKLSRKLREAALVEVLAKAYLEKKVDFEDKKKLAKLEAAVEKAKLPFETKIEWDDKDGNHFDLRELGLPFAMVGTISSFSNSGPTRDGRLKPEICAPGQEIASCFSNDAPPGSPSSSFTSPFEEYPNMFILAGDPSSVPFSRVLRLGSHVHIPAASLFTATPLEPPAQSVIPPGATQESSESSSLPSNGSHTSGRLLERCRRGTVRRFDLIRQIVDLRVENMACFPYAGGLR